MTGIRDPMPVFWEMLTKRYRAIAKLVLLKASITITSDYEDLAQTTLLKTQAFVDMRRFAQGKAFKLDEAFFNECVKYGAACMKNAFLDEIRFARRRSSLFDPCCDTEIYNSVVEVRSSDERAIAQNWIEKMRSRSKGAAFQRMLTALAELIAEGFPDISLNDVADRAKASYNDIYRFKMLVQDTRADVAEKGQAL